MYNLDEIVKMYLYCVSPSDILKEENGISYSQFTLNEFQRMSRVYLPKYSDTESRQLFHYVEDSVRSEGHPYAGMAGRSGLNVFAALEELAEQLLVLEDNRVLCQYIRLLRYRDITRFLDEDSVICAFLAVRYKRYREEHTYFAWEATIGHNNVQLNKILGRGISENHFHLYGSAPSYLLMWIYMMNHVMDISFAKLFAELDEKPRNSRNHYYSGYEEEKHQVRILRAALIRVCITVCITSPELFRIKGLLSLELAKELIEGKQNIEDYRSEIQKLIDMVTECEMMYGKDQLQDYLLYRISCNGTQDMDGGSLFSGERWLIYQILSRELQGKDSTYIYQWFYAYLVIKNNFRAELVQTNDNVGFENFSIYAKRKKYYKNIRQMARSAVRGVLSSGNVKSLELRIKPEDTSWKNGRLIRELDCQLRDVAASSFIPPVIYYVFHFVKQSDDRLVASEVFDGRRCRHYELRGKLGQKAEALIGFREKYQEAASHVLGIDACSQEIGCRPEVFAPIFRRLSEHVVQDIPDAKVRQLRLTYHVGEDFLDAADGLRAVDEAVCFLNLKCGDRIGHGTVLGIDVRKWYEYKCHTIIISKQDYLDNVVWLYQKLQEFHIKDCENLKQYLRKQYDIYFSQIYGHLMEPDSNAYIWMNQELKRRIQNGTYHFSINTYYDAWKLRGDMPELYLEGVYRERLEYCFEDYMVNRHYPEDFRIREREDAGLLYYLYHYNWRVRSIGKEMEEIYIPKNYVDGVDAVQKAYCRYFAALGIGVETNPSSNLLISTMNSYQEHTTPRFYNQKLTGDADSLAACPQVNISINTDDKGVFGTSLENEYSLLACAMEKVKDEEQQPLYNRQMVYQWLDDIREMGNLQSFHP